MNVENMNDESFSAPTTVQLLRELKAPLINARNFQEEMGSVIARMQDLLPDDDTRMSAVDNAELKALLKQELIPCLELSLRTLEQMQFRMRELEEISELACHSPKDIGS